MVPAWLVVVVVLLSCWRLFLRWRKTRQMEILGAILNRLLCFAAIYIYFSLDEPPVEARSWSVRLTITAFFLAEVIMSLFTRNRPHA